MTFSKLDSGITKSSLWSEALHVRIVFLSFLAEKDENGFVSGSRTGMIRVCNVTPEQFDNAIEILSSPDPDSKSSEFEGRRISKCEGGWVVLNSDKYRLPEQSKKTNRNEYMAKYMAEYRAVNNVNINRKLTPVNGELTSVSVSVSDSVSSEEDSKEKQTAQEKITFQNFRKRYPGQKRGNETEFDNFKKRHKDYKIVLPELEQIIINQIKWRKEMSLAGMFVPSWKNLQTWINNRCWEEEKPVIEKQSQQQNLFKQPMQSQQEPHYRRV